MVPVAGTQDDRDNAGLAPFVALHRARHLNAVAVIGAEEVRAQQEQYDVRAEQLIVDLSVETLAGSDPPIVPCRDHALAEESSEVLLELVSQYLVGVRATEEDMSHGRWASRNLLV